MATRSSNRRRPSGRASIRGMLADAPALLITAPSSKTGKRGIRCASQWEASYFHHARACVCDTSGCIRCQEPGLLRGVQAAGLNRKHAVPGRLHCRSHARLDDSDAEVGGEIQVLHDRCRKSAECSDRTLLRKVLPTFKRLDLTLADARRASHSK